MSIFSKIKDAIFGHKAEAATPPADAPAIPMGATVAAAAPVDVAASLGAMQGADNLNWRTSVVDLMKLVGIDASYESRKALAEPLVFSRIEPGNHEAASPRVLFDIVP